MPKIIHALVGLGFVLAFAPSAFAVKPNELESSVEDAGEKKWIPRMQVSVSHYGGFMDDSDPFTVLTASGSWKVFKSYNLSVSQSVTKVYAKYAGDQEVLPSDTKVSLSRVLKSLSIAGFKPRMSVSATLPVSEFSRRQSVWSRGTLAASADRSFLEGKLYTQLNASAGYYFNRYKTTVTDPGDAGGNPLRQAVFGLGQFVSYQVEESLSLESSFGLSKVRYYDIGFVNPVSYANRSALLGTDYYLQANVSWSYADQLTFIAGFDQSDRYEKFGGVRQAYLFDRYTSNWFVGAYSIF